MPHEPEKYLFDMKDSCEFLMGFVHGKTLENMRNDRGFRSAVERELQIIGEALIQLNKASPEIAERISEHKRIIHFRHVLVHGYDMIDPAIVWAVLEDKLPVMLDELSDLLPDEHTETD